ncbi:MAG: multicopper oxidase domain-containing protein [Myxococcota bacterium]|nr:multicopper oxidase domain-containing protein [Myxococcota bacterium]
MATAGLVAGAGTAVFRPEVGHAAGHAGQTGSHPYVPTPGPAEYDFEIQRTTLNPDGQKPMPGVTVNGVMPGPEIRVKRGDLLRIRTGNRLADEPTSIHWHGLLLPAGMDGVPDVSNVPTAARGMYVYEYPIRQAGSYWYHSHFGLQEQIGLFGAYVIEDEDEPNQADRDAVVLLSDWLHRDPYKVFEELKTPSAKAKPPSSGPDLADIQYASYLVNGKSVGDPWTLEVEPGESVRLRVTGAGASTYFRVSLDEHPLEITHVNGPAVEPVEVDEFLIGPGEGYDARVRIEKPGSYTLHAVTQAGDAQALGVIHTRGVAPTPNRSIPKPAERALTLSMLRAIEPTTLPPGKRRDLRVVLGGDMKNYIWMMNGQAYPKADRLVVGPGERVGIEMVNETGMWHPMHLHGHFFRALNGAGERSPLMHTISVPPRKTVKIEFTADNPGNWFFHCHNLYHLDAGMARVVEYQV